MEISVKLPKGVKAQLKDNELIMEGPKGSTSKVFKTAFASVKVKDDEVIIKSVSENRRSKSHVNTLKAHVKNLIKGVQEGYEARLAIRYAHFPVTVKVSGGEVIIENFSGEKVPRKARIMNDCEVKVEGSEVIINGLNKEYVGQTAANIELATKVKNKDLRVFQDGIWITKKPGRKGL